MSSSGGVQHANRHPGASCMGGDRAADEELPCRGRNVEDGIELSDALEVGALLRRLHSRELELTPKLARAADDATPDRAAEAGRRSRSMSSTFTRASCAFPPDQAHCMRLLLALKFLMLVAVGAESTIMAAEHRQADLHRRSCSPSLSSVSKKKKSSLAMRVRCAPTPLHACAARPNRSRTEAAARGNNSSTEPAPR